MGMRFLFALLNAMGTWPLARLRAVGRLLGRVLYVLAAPRRRVVLRNLAVCFPQWSDAQREAVARQTFVNFCQAWLDRFWLWQAPEPVLRERLRLVGDWKQALTADGDLREALVLFSPHFYGLDAGWTALTLMTHGHYDTIYTPQRNATFDAWMMEGRKRYGSVRLLRREDRVKTIIGGLRQGHGLYLLPDMNFGPEESIFVPFYGVQAATVPSLSRFAKLGGAKVRTVLTRMTPTGYEVELSPAWEDFPTADFHADTAQMNLRLQALIDTMPDQYYWVHKRFKTRPEGDPSIY